MRAAFVIAFLAFIGLSVYAHLQPRLPGDLELTLWLQSLPRGALETALHSISFMAAPLKGGLVLTLLCALFLVLFKLWQEGVLLLATFVPDSLVYILKELVSRPRPEPALAWVASPLQDPSFPSGSATHAMVFGGLLIFITSQRLSGWRQRTAQALLAAFIFAAGLSRIYLGAHWPSDVLGAYLFGGISLASMIFLFHRWTKEGKPTASGSRDQLRGL